MKRKKEILVVEDNELNRALLCEILSEEYTTLEAENGLTALEVLRKNRENISLILLDIVMPVMDGLTFLDQIREDEELSLIPVIVTTQSDNEEDEVKALAHGANDFVPKPYRPKIILHRVSSLIKLRENAAMVNQFQYDRLTGLYSKDFFVQKVRERLLENPDEEYCIVCSNIVNFKLVNEIFGVAEGDRLLKEIAEISLNMIDEDGICGRFTADRFLILQKRDKEKMDRMDYGKHPLQKLSSVMKTIDMCWGIYEITDRTLSVEQMCDRALLAVNSIKEQYNQHFAVYDDSLREKLMEEKRITDAMRPALLNREFVVYYQPKYNLKENCIGGAEALVRWNHPGWGILYPADFVPIFEKNGFIYKMDLLIWEMVCEKLSEWKQKGYPMLPVSVNVSRADVYQTHFVETLKGLIHKYDLDPAWLHLEITETVYTENYKQLISIVEQLRDVGFIVEMDDFGSGYSSMNMLSQIELDVLKIDMKFIQSEMMKPEEKSILNDLISMAHRLDMSVVAEGIETEEHLQRLKNGGCDYGQGYLFSRPLPVSEYEALLCKTDKTCK